MSHKASYSKLFVPPKYLEMPAVCIEILPKGISFLTTKKNELGILPVDYGFVSLPPGAVSGGQVLRKEPVIKALTEIKKKTGASFARLSIPEEKTYIFKTNLPKLEQKEIRDILDFKIEENVPLSAKDAVFDFDVIPYHKNKDSLDVVVSVAPLNTIEELQNILEIAGLTPMFFSPESGSVAKSVISDANEQVVVMANIRESNIVLSLVVYGVVCQTSSISFGGSTFTDLLAKYFKVTNEEAIKIKQEKLYTENPDNMEIFSYLINTISAIKDEIYKFISYCNEREDLDGQVDKIILCGRDALIVGFDKYLYLNLNMRVEVADIWINNFEINTFVPEISKLESMDLVVVNGLSLY